MDFGLVLSFMLGKDVISSGSIYVDVTPILVEAYL